MRRPCHACRPGCEGCQHSHGGQQRRAHYELPPGTCGPACHALHHLGVRACVARSRVRMRGKDKGGRQGSFGCDAIPRSKASHQADAQLHTCSMLRSAVACSPTSSHECHTRSRACGCTCGCVGERMCVCPVRSSQPRPLALPSQFNPSNLFWAHLHQQRALCFCLLAALKRLVQRTVGLARQIRLLQSCTGARGAALAAV